MSEEVLSYYYKKERRLALDALNQDCSEILNKSLHCLIRQYKDITSTVLNCIWTKFAERHQKSPSHVNNNVQGCLRHRTRSFNKSKSPKQSSSCIDSPHEIPATTKRPGPVLNLNLYRLFHIFLGTVEILMILLWLLYGTLAVHRPTQSLISRNTQDLIYPFFRWVRLLSLPLVRGFPSITDFYEESCLVTNPYYFKMSNVDCWPCETVRHVIDLTGFSNFSSAYHDSGIPFVVKDALKTEVGLNYLRSVYFQNYEIMSKVRFESNVNGLNSFEELFEREDASMLISNEIHISWKINRVILSRILRRYFPKPYFIPEGTEVSIQHFLYLDSWKSRSYTLPLTEFANVFVTQVSGSRYIALIPRESCHQVCKVVSTLLQPNDVLFYNWLFWRPRSVPMDAKSSNSNLNISVTYIGSFY